MFPFRSRRIDCVLATGLLAALVSLAPAAGHGAVAVVSTTSGAVVAGNANYTIGPVAVTAGNVLVGHVVTANTLAIPTGPAGWNRVAYSSSVTGNFALTTWIYTVPASGSFSYSWGSSPTTSWAGGITQYSGADSFCPVGATGTASGTSIAAAGKRSRFNLPVVTTLVPNAMLDAGYGAGVKNVGYTVPAGWTARVVSKANTNNTPSAGSADRLQAGVGGSGTYAVTMKAAAGAFVSDLIELDPPDTAGIVLAPGTISFATVQGSSPASQTFTIRNAHLKGGPYCGSQSYTSAVSFSAGWDATNLPAPDVSTVSLAQGDTSAAIAVTISSGSLAAGTYTAVVTITDASGNTATINVTLSVACSIQRRSNVATATAGAATQLTLTEPSGWGVGDALVAVLAADTTTAPGTPAGWTLVASNTTAGLGMWMYRAAKGASATTTWTGFAAGKLAGVMASYLNANNYTWLDAPAIPFTPATTSSGDGNVDANACTTGTADTEVVAAYAINMAAAGTTLSVGAGLASISGTVSTGSGVGDIELNVGSDLIVAADGTPVAETGGVTPAQAASKLGALCTLRSANVPPAVSVTRAPVAPSQGDTITYTILVTNPAGNGPLTTLVLSDTLPADVTFVSLSADAAGAGLTLSNNPGTGAVEGAFGNLTPPLAAGTAVTFTLQGSLACGATAAQSSTAFAQTADTCGAPGVVLNAFTPGVLAAPAVTAVRDLVSPTQGDTVTYTIAVQNTNTTAPLNTLAFSDTLPAGLSLESIAVDASGDGLVLASSGQVVGASGTLTTPLAAASSVTFTVAARVGCGETAAQSNQAYVETASNCQHKASTADTFTPQVLASAPTVAVRHTPAAPAPGDAVTYMIVVRNTATSSLNSLVMSDTLPSGIDFVSLVGGSDGSGDGLDLSMNPGAGAVEGASGLFAPGYELMAGASFTFTLTGVVNCAASGVQGTSAYAETAGGCWKALSTADAFSLAPAAVSVVKTQVTPAAGATIVAGDLVRYRIVVANAGAVTITSLTVVDTLAPQVVDVTTTATGFALPGVAGAGGGGTVYAWSATGLTMGPGVSYTFSVTGRAGVTCAAAVIGNTAYASAGTACGAGILAASGAAGTFTLGPPSIGVSVVKALLTLPVTTGDSVQYRIVVANTGTSTVTALSVVDTVAPSMTAVTTDQPAGFGAPAVADSAGGAGTVYGWSAAGLAVAPAATLTFTITGQVGSVFAPVTVGNTAYVVAADGCAAVAGTASSSTFTAAAPAVLAGAAAAYPSPVCAGGAILVTLTVTNTGGAAANGVAAPAFVVGGPGGAGGATGPSPAFGGALAGGASVTYSWTFTASAAGPVDFTTTPTATDAVSGLAVTGNRATSAPVTVQTPGALAVAAAATPQVSVGQWIAVALTVTNTGGTAVTGLTATVFVGPGSVTWETGAVPAGPLTLNAGSAVTFVWSYSASGAGTPVFSLTVTGVTCGGPVFAGTTVPVTVQTPASLAAALAAVPSSVGVGQSFLVTLTVTNTGQAAATIVTPAVVRVCGPGAASFLAGPEPAPPVPLAGGASVTFTWTYSGAAAGTVDFSTTVAGTDGNAGWAVAIGPVASGAVTIAPSGNLVSRATVSSLPVSIGQWITVELTVTNEGGVPANGVTPGLVNASTAALSLVAGPVPAGPVVVAAGAGTTFVWTFSASGAGSLTLSLTATGTDGGTGDPLYTFQSLVVPVAVQTPASLAASLDAWPSPRDTGQPFLVTLTVTNSGQATATGVNASAFLIEGTGAASAVGGPTPALPATIPGGSSVVFTWTYAGTSAGTVVFTTTVAGLDGNAGWALTTGPVQSGAVAIQTPAALAAAAAILPPQVSVGQGFLVTVTVTNTGGATANGVTAAPLLEAGAGVTVVGGPWPAGPVSLGTAAAVTFTWSFTAATAGTAAFTATATGTDANTAAALTTGPASVSGLIQTAAVLSRSLDAWPSPRNTGQGFLVTLTVTNAGQAAATGVAASSFLLEGTGGAAVVGGPTPSLPATIPGGGSVVYTWTFSGASAGNVVFTTTVSGSDGNSGAALTTGPARSGVVVVQTPAALVAAAAMLPPQVSVGQAFLVTITVTNTGGAAASVVAAAPLLETGAGVTPAGGPWPAGPVSLGSGTAVTFTWTFTAASAGTAVFTATATGTDANTAAALTTGPASVSGLIQTAAVLTASLDAWPSLRNTGQGFLVTLTVTNAGQAAATGVAASSFLLEGTGGAAPAGGPVPALPATISGGTSMVFTWTYSGSATGSVWFTTTVSGSDGNVGWVLATGPAQSGVVIVQAPAVLAASAAALPATVGVGQAMLLTVTVTNTGGATANTVAPAAPTVAGTGALSVVAGPFPAGSVSLAGGVPVVFTWTYDGASVGTAWFTTTVTGTDANDGAALASGPVTAGPVTVVPAGSLLPAIAVSPLPVSVGQWIRVALTVTNTGGTAANGVMPSLVSGSTAALTLISGPVPPGPVTLASGAGATFVWTFSAAGAGSVALSLTATGIDGGSGDPLYTAADVAGLVQTPATLAASVAMLPAQVSVGQAFLVTVTVTNTGMAGATSVAPAMPAVSGTGAAVLVDGPFPPIPVPLTGGGAVTFTWTLTAATAGPLGFTSTVTGADGNAGWAVTTGPVAAAGLVQTAPSLTASLDAFPSPRNTGQAFFVTLTVTNTGEAAAMGVNTSAFLLEGTGGAAAVDGPIPVLPATIPGGGSVVYTWTFTGAAAGSVVLTTTVAGADGNAGWAVTTGAVRSGAMTVESPASLVAATAMLPPQVSVGQPFLVTVTLTNTGGATATGVTAAPLLETGAGGTPTGGPWPAGPVSLGGGGAVTFTWSFTAATAGTAIFTATATGTDANTTASLISGPASVAGLVQTPAALAVSSVLFPASVGQGQALWLTVTVTNTGQAAVTGVTPAAPAGSGTGSVALLAGPWPASPLALAGGAAVTFTWTYSGGAVGNAELTTTVTGADGNAGWPLASGPVTAGPVAVTPSAALVSAATASPLPVSVGQWFTVTFTVTNEGGTAANAVTPALVSGSTAALTLVTGPAPAGTLAPGAAATFVWAYSSQGAGTVALSLTATGTDAGTGASVYTTRIVAGVVQTPAALDASSAMLPARVSVGQSFLVTVTVTNTGQAGATSVAPAMPAASGTGAAVLVDGPFPSIPVPLTGGGAVTFTWTLTASAAGPISLTSTVTGVDGNAGWAVTTGPVTAAGTVETPAALAASLAAFPSPRNVGQGFLVTLTVTNAGQAAATGVNASAFLVEGTGGASLAGGPAPSLPTVIIGGTAVVFTWTFNGASAGTVRFTTTAAGMDGNAGWALTTGPAVSGAVVVEGAAALATSVAVLPNRVSVGQSFLVTMTFTNTGGATANSVGPAGPWPSGTGGVLFGPAGAWPVPPVTLPAGSAVSFTWTMTASAAGGVSFTGTGTGVDANSFAFLTATPPASPAVLAIETPAALSVQLAVSATTVQEGTAFRVTMTVSNSGGASAVGVPLPVLAVWGSGGGTVAAAPGGFPASVPGGATVSFTWTVTAGSAGSAGLSLTVTGADANAGSPLAVFTVAPATVTVLPGPALIVDSVTATPASVRAGETITVTATVRNSGGLPAASVSPVAGVTGSGRADAATGPVPAGAASLGAGETATFTYTFVAAGAGTVSFTVRAVAGNAPASAEVASAPVTITAGGQNPSDVVVGPHPFRPASGGSLTFSSVPASSTVRIFTIAGEPVATAAADSGGTATWNGRNDAGTVVVSGVYIFVVEAPGGRRFTGKFQVDR